MRPSAIRMSLVCGRKPERTYTDTGTTCRLRTEKSLGSQHCVKTIWNVNVLKIYTSYQLIFGGRQYDQKFVRIKKNPISHNHSIWWDAMLKQMFKSFHGKQCKLSGCQDCHSGAHHNHFTYSGVSVAKYLARRNKNGPVRRIPILVPCLPPFCWFPWITSVCRVPRRSVQLLQRDGLFKATQVVDNEKWNEIYDTRWGLTRGDFLFACPITRVDSCHL